MSQRIYITLNPNKNNDKIIIDYLNATYNSSSAIKHILYEYIVNDNITMNRKWKIKMYKNDH